MGSILMNISLTKFAFGSTNSSLNCIYFCNSQCSNFRRKCRVMFLNVIVRSLSVNECDDSEQEHYVDYSKFKEERVANKKLASVRIQKVLGCSLNDAELMIGAYPELKYVNAKDALYNLQFFQSKGVQEEKLHQNPWLLAYKSGTISAKLEMLRKMDLADDVSSAVPLLQLPQTKLKQFAALAESESSIIPQRNRIKYICDKLECNLEEACHLFVKHPFLYSIPFERFSSIVDLLLGADISPPHILRDMWVFRYSPKSIKSRIEKYKEAGVKTIKPWMLRCSSKAFTNKFRREMSRKELLGEKTIVDYLTQRLDCGDETIEYMSLRYPSILKVHVSKLKEILDFVFGKGYDSSHILLVPRILLGSVETTKSRFMELENLGYTPSSLIVLCKSKRQYNQFVYMLKKNAEKSNVV